MEYQDAEVSDITIVLKKECADKMDETVTALRGLDMEIENTDADKGVVEGTILADKLAHIRTWPCVEYVRVEFTYIAEHRVGNVPNENSASEELDGED